VAPPDPFGLPGLLLDGQFRVDRFVGEGGVSALYQGFHIGLNEPIAIKCLKVPHPFGERDSFIKRFREESRVLYRLSQANTNVVRNIAGGATTVPATGALLPYMVLEWLDGRSLANDFDFRAAQGHKPRSLDDMMRVLESAVDGLAYANAQGVVHGDVNPRNMFIANTPQGAKTKMLDFGIARIMGDPSLALPSDSLTLGGFRLFAPAYAAPEQFDPSVGPVGTWSDVYSLALVALRSISGKAARSGTQMSEFAAAALDSAKIPSPLALGLQVSQDVDATFKRALAVRPNDRWQDVGEFWHALKMASQSKRGAMLPSPSHEKTSHTLRPESGAPPQKGPVLSIRTPAGLLSPKRPMIRHKDSPLILTKEEGQSVPPGHESQAPFSSEATLVDAKIPPQLERMRPVEKTITDAVVPPPAPILEAPKAPAIQYDEDGPTLMHSPSIEELGGAPKKAPAAPLASLPPLPPLRATSLAPRVKPPPPRAPAKPATPPVPSRAPGPPPSILKSETSEPSALDPQTFVASAPDFSKFKDGAPPAIAEKSPEMLRPDESEFSRSVPLGAKVLSRLSEAAPQPGAPAAAKSKPRTEMKPAMIAAIGGTTLGITLLIGFAMMGREKPPPPPEPTPIKVIAVPAPSPPPPEPIVIPADLPDAAMR